MPRKYRQDKQSLLERYSEYLKQINEDLARIEEEDPDSVTLDRWRGYFQPITTPDPNYNALRKAVSQIRKVAESGMLSQEGQERSRANAIETLKQSGIEGINKRNFNSYMRFLDDARSRGLAAVYSSTQLIRAIREAKDHKLSDSEIRANIDKWSRNSVRYDKEGKQVEVISPPKLNVRHTKSRRR